MNMFARAKAGLNLSPAERAVLRLVEGLLATALVAALPVLADALSQQSVNWGLSLRAALAAGAVAIMLALAKYARAHGDAPIGATVGQALESFATTIPARLGVSDVKTPILEAPAVVSAVPTQTPETAPAPATAPVTATAGG